MKKLIKKQLFLTLLTMMSVNSVVAQSMINTVVPGSDGNLPTPPVIAQAEAGHFGGLTLKSVYLDKTDRIWLADLQIPVIEDGEAEVQYSLNGTDGWTGASTFYFHTVKFPASETAYFRLVISGGAMNGYVSNVVKALKPKDKFHIGIGYSEPNFIAVGNDVYAHYIDMSLIIGDNVRDIDRTEVFDNCHYKWYRQNPNTGEQTLIEGQTNDIYTPILEDVGYELVSVMYGDENFADFYTSHCHGIVLLPILTSTEHMNEQGVIINTNYVLPDPEKDLWMLSEGENGSEPKPFPASSVKTIKPGQYSISMNTPENLYIPWGYGESPYILCMSSENWDSFREFFLIEDMLSSIPGVIQNDEKNIVDRYSISGQRMNANQRGIMIERTGNGQTKKVLIK